MHEAVHKHWGDWASLWNPLLLARVTIPLLVQDFCLQEGPNEIYQCFVFIPPQTVPQSKRTEKATYHENGFHGAEEENR